MVSHRRRNGPGARRSVSRAGRMRDMPHTGRMPGNVASAVEQRGPTRHLGRPGRGRTPGAAPGVAQRDSGGETAFPADVRPAIQKGGRIAAPVPDLIAGPEYEWRRE